MKWPWQDADNDGKPDDIFGDTYVELFLLWNALALTALIIMGIAQFFFGG